MPPIGIKYIGHVYINSIDNTLVQDLYEAAAQTTAAYRFVRKAFKSGDTWTFKKWFQYKVDDYETTADKAARILQDFTYVIDPDTDHVVLTGWKETLNGEPSNDLVIPETDEIVIEI